MNIARLNVFATAEEIAAIKDACGKPLIAFTNPAPPGPDVPHAIPMYPSPIEVVHAAALAHGLPEIPGWYGIDLENGEFVSVPE